MKITLNRHTFTEASTIGDLYMGNEFICHILEDTDRWKDTAMTVEEMQEIKVKGKTCIPYGEYEVKYTYSPKYKRKMLLIAGVPVFKGIRIHIGNYPKDTEGCPLPGLTKGLDFVGNSKVATKKVYDKLVPVLESGEEVTINIIKAGS